MDINAVYCRNCHEIIYSRADHDFRSCTCGKVAVDGKGLRTIISDIEDFTSLILDGDVLLDQILAYDWRYGNKNAKEFPNGYCGKFKIDKYSNFRWYEKLIKEGDILAIKSDMLLKK